MINNNDKVEFKNVIEKIKLAYNEKKKDHIYIIKKYIDYVCGHESEKDKILSYEKRFNRMQKNNPSGLQKRNKKFFTMIEQELDNNINDDNAGIKILNNFNENEINKNIASMDHDDKLRLERIGELSKIISEEKNPYEGIRDNVKDIRNNLKEDIQNNFKKMHYHLDNMISIANEINNNNVNEKPKIINTEYPQFLIFFVINCFLFLIIYVCLTMMGF